MDKQQQDEVKRYNIMIRVSKHERDTIRELATGKGLTVSEYMRMMSIDRAQCKQEAS